LILWLTLKPTVAVKRPHGRIVYFDAPIDARSARLPTKIGEKR
jgi:hypothetical protein